MRRAVLTTLVLLSLLPAGAAASPQRTSMQAVLPYVMCVTCGIPLGDAQSPQADRERAFIQQLIYRGDTLGQVKAALVAQYGTQVLALPPAQGFDLTVYVVPIVVVVALIALMALLLPRWRRNRIRAVGAVPQAPTALSAADAARIDADLAQFD